MEISTEMVVLRKTPYMETSLIISGLSPDYGKVDLLLKGELKISEKKAPVADLFRELSVKFHESRNSELHTAIAVELIAEHDGIAAVPENYRLGRNIGEFIISNTHPELPCPQTSQTLCNVLCHLASDGNEEMLKKRFFGLCWKRLHSLVLIKTAFLHENGLMPDNFAADEERNYEQQLFIEQIVEAGLGDKPLPERPDSYWKVFNEWLTSLCRYHNLKLPTTPATHE